MIPNTYEYPIFVKLKDERNNIKLSKSSNSINQRLNANKK